MSKGLFSPIHRRYNGPEATGSSKPDDDDGRVQKKSENVAHAPDGINLTQEAQEFNTLVEFAYDRSARCRHFSEIPTLREVG
jgi:hypothetical protein